MSKSGKSAPKSPSTVSRARRIQTLKNPSTEQLIIEGTHLYYGDSLEFYRNWAIPDVIISDGAYGILGFDGDTSDHTGIAEWYEPHIAEWSKRATPGTTLWFWNSEIGWATAHPILERYGWRYINTNIWDKGIGHIAGNVNTNKIRRFPVVTEVCVQYVFDARIDNLSLKEWLLKEWKRSGLAMYLANEACEVKAAATRKYLDQSHLWYFPPEEAFEKLSNYANSHGLESGRPYFSVDGIEPLTGQAWSKMRSKFYCPMGKTNVWSRPALRDNERVRAGNKGKDSVVHLNQKPLDLMRLIIEASSDVGDVVWEPFGGLFTGSLASKQLNRISYAAEIDPTYYHYGRNRFNQLPDQFPIL